MVYAYVMQHDFFLLIAAITFIEWKKKHISDWWIVSSFPCRTGGYGIVLPLFYIDSSLHLAELVDRVVTTFRPYRCYFVCSKKVRKGCILLSFY